MAFNRAPSQSTYQTKDVKLIAEINNRDKTGTKDVIALNGFYDIIKNKTTQDGDYHFVKRDGTTTYAFTVPSTNFRGAYFWEDLDKLFVAYDDKIAVMTASTGALITTLSPAGWSSGATDVGFTEFNYNTGVVNLVVSDGVKLITIDSSNTIVVGSSPDMPTPHSPHIVFIDGYIFMVKSGTSDIYNSDVDAPLAFTAGSFISVEMIPDSLIRISRLNNYLVAFGSASIEYFYDAANASGSPLNRNDTPVKQVGYLGGLATYANKIYFVGQTSKTPPEVFVLEDFKIETLDVPPLRRYVQPYTTYEGAIVSFGGHDFYVMSVGDITYIHDLETRIWTRLSRGAASTFPIKYAVNLPIATKGNCSLAYVQGTTTLVYFDPTIYQDSTVNFPVTMVTDQETFDTLHEKYMSRLIVYADKTSTSTTLSIETTDDDYQTYSTARTVDLSLELPALTRLGRFRRRAYRLGYSDNYPLRLHHLEVDFNIGGR